jgi:hypothetical protein
MRSRQVERLLQSAALPLVVIVSACGRLGCGTPPPALTREALANAAYTSHWTGSGEIRLVEGRFRSGAGGPPVEAALLEPVAFGDLDGDGDMDAAAPLSIWTGGSGIFVELAAVVSERGGPRQAASAPLGDRVKVERLAIEGGLVRVDLLTHGESDPMCCPNRRETKVYRLQGSALVEQP